MDRCARPIIAKAVLSPPVIVRLPNWVGDVVMALPAIDRLERAGLTPWLVGKRWAADLLRGHGWRVAPLAATSAERVAALRRWHDAARSSDASFDRAANTLLLPNSLSSAWEAWRAGLKGLGYRQDGRGLLLKAAIAAPRGNLHESVRFDRLAVELLARRTAPVRPYHRDRVQADHGMAEGAATMPASPQLRVSAEDQQRASETIMKRLGGRPFGCLVPFAAGKLDGRTKAWPGFPALARRLAETLPLVVVPGPGEVELARSTFPMATSLEGLDLGTYAAILQQARVVVANDTGPAHVAAAVGASVVSVLGPTDPDRYRPLGPRVTIVRAQPWPTEAAVAAAAFAAIERST